MCPEVQPASISAFVVMTPPPKIDQNPPHQLSGHTEKVRTILPLCLPDID